MVSTGRRFSDEWHNKFGKGKMSKMIGTQLHIKAIFCLSFRTHHDSWKMKNNFWNFNIWIFWVFAKTFQKITKCSSTVWILCTNKPGVPNYPDLGFTQNLLLDNLGYCLPTLGPLFKTGLIFKPWYDKGNIAFKAPT